MTQPEEIPLVFEFQSIFYVHFRINTQMNIMISFLFFFSSRNGFNSSTTILLQEWLRY